MEERPNLKITYYAFGANSGVEDFNNIETFKKEIHEHYSSLVKPIIIGRGGSAYEFVIEQYNNLPIGEYLTILSLYLAKKIIDKTLVDPLLEKYLLTPLKHIKNLKRKILY